MGERHLSLFLADSFLEGHSGVKVGVLLSLGLLYVTMRRGGNRCRVKMEDDTKKQTTSLLSLLSLLSLFYLLSLLFLLFLLFSFPPLLAPSLPPLAPSNCRW